MSPEVRQKMPGQGEYTVVSFIDGADEFSKQKPRDPDEVAEQAGREVDSILENS
jgi:hypothetical protein